MQERDETHLRRAIELSEEARRAGDRPFGSVLVGPDGRVLAEDRNTVMTDRDITAHPELKLARWAAARLDPQTARGTTMYTSCQPCAMCASAIERSGIGRVMFGLSREQREEIEGSAQPAAEVREEGPFLFEEASGPVARFFEEHGA